MQFLCSNHSTLFSPRQCITQYFLFVTNKNNALCNILCYNGST
nr:MAG TPA: hypothetical protein [Caudoviricetes sp.]